MIDKSNSKSCNFGYIIIIADKINTNIDNFNLYLGMDNLKELFNEDSFLIAFWLHFLAINLFCGSWIVKDSHKYLMPKISTFFPLIITYFIGPLGIVLYWFIRIFFAKKINLHD